MENEQLYWKGMSFKVYWMNEQKTIKMGGLWMMNKQILKNLTRPLAKQYFFYKFHFAWKFSTNLLILKISIKWIEPNLYWCKRFHKTWAKLHKIVKIYRNFVFGGNLLLTQVTNPRKFGKNILNSPVFSLNIVWGLVEGFQRTKPFVIKCENFWSDFANFFTKFCIFFRK